MTIDTIALRKKIGSKFLTQNDFVSAVGFSHSFVSRLLNGHVENITLSMIYKIVETLDMTKEETLSIFFCENDTTIK